MGGILRDNLGEGNWETDFYPVRVLRTLSIRFPDASPVLDKNRAPMGPDILSSTGAVACRKAAPKAIPDSSSVLDKVLTLVCE